MDNCVHIPEETREIPKSGCPNIHALDDTQTNGLKRYPPAHTKLKLYNPPSRGYAVIKKSNVTWRPWTGVTQAYTPD